MDIPFLVKRDLWERYKVYFFHVSLSCLPKKISLGEENIWGQEMNPCWSFGGPPNNDHDN